MADQLNIMKMALTPVRSVVITLESIFTQTHGHHPNPTSHLPLKICNTEVMFVDSFTYLGSLITNDGSSSRDITYRIAKAASAVYRLPNPLFRKHRISIQTKINMYRALVVSVLLYGSEAWATTLADRRRLDVFNMHCHCLSKAPPVCVLAAAHQQP